MTEEIRVRVKRHIWVQDLDMRYYTCTCGYFYSRPEVVFTILEKGFEHTPQFRHEVELLHQVIRGGRSLKFSNAIVKRWVKAVASYRGVREIKPIPKPVFALEDQRRAADALKAYLAMESEKDRKRERARWEALGVGYQPGRTLHEVKRAETRRAIGLAETPYRTLGKVGPGPIEQEPVCWSCLDLDDEESRLDFDFSLEGPLH